MRVFLSTVVRGAPIERGGEVIALDWTSKKILNRVPIYPANPSFDDPNTRGGGRGGRGIAVLPKEIFVASYHTLHGFDYELRPTRNITHRNFAGLHEVKPVKEGIWVSSTPLAAVLKVDLNGNVLQQWWAHDDPVVQDRFESEPIHIDKEKDNRLAYLEDFSKLHLNNVEVHDGRVYVCLNNHGAVLRLFPTEVVAVDPDLKGCHNGLVTEAAEILVNDSHHHTLIVFDLGTGKIKRRIDLAKFPEVSALARASGFTHVPWHVRLRNAITRKRMSRPLFTRGMCRIDERRVLLGVSPATVLEVDYREGKLLDFFQIGHGANECIHGLEAVPSIENPV